MKPTISSKADAFISSLTGMPKVTKPQVKKTAWADIPIEDPYSDVKKMFKRLQGTFVFKMEVQVEKVMSSPEPDATLLSFPNLLESQVSREDISMVFNELWAPLPSWSKARTVFMSYPYWFSKNKCATGAPASHVFNHLFMALGMAHVLSLDYIIIDVDSLFNPMLPSAADITLFDPKIGLIYVDVTMQASLDGKIPNLLNSASSVAFREDISIHVAAISSSPLFTIGEVEVGSDHQNIDWALEPEALTSKLFPAFQKAEVSELSALRSVLASIIEPCLDTILPTLSTNQNSVDKLKPTAMRFLRLVQDHFNLSEEAAIDRLLALITGRTCGISSFYKEIRNLDPDFFKQDSFLSAGFEGMKVKANPKKLLIPPPVTFLNDFFPEPKNTHTLDVTFWVGKTTRSLSDSWAPGNPTKYVFLTGGKVEEMSSEIQVKVDFETRQSIQHHFPDEVVAYVSLPTFIKSTYLHKGSEITLREYEELSQKSGANLEALTVLETEMTTSYFQVLLNPSYQTDDNFIDFLNRANKSYGNGSYEQWVDAAEVEGINEEEFLSLSRGLVPTPNEILMQAISLRSSRRKTEMVMKTKSAPAVASQMCCMSGRTSSLLVNLIDAVSSQAKAYSTFLNIRHGENCAVFLESQDYAFYGFWYLSGTWPGFKTTWRKFYSVTEVEDLSHYNVSTLMGSLGTLEYNHDRIMVTSLVDPSLVEVAQSIDEDSLTVAARMSVLKGVELNLGKRSLCLTASKFHSVDRMHLEWELECVNKALCRIASLCEYRTSLYAKLNNPKSEMGVPNDLDEINLNLMTFLQNRQQFSVISTAWRYLHQALGSLDFDPVAIMAKITECTIKSRFEVLYLSRMSSIYKVALMVRVIKNINFIRSNNREVFVSAPDMFYASNLASLNVSTYSTSNALNTQKQWRVSSEASCVLAAWEQVTNLETVKSQDKDLWLGMNRDLFGILMSAPIASVDDLTAVLKANANLLASHTLKLLSHSKASNYCSDYFFEMLTHVELRLDKGTMSAMSALGGKNIKEFLTMKGSTICTKLESFDSNPAVRKATASIIMLARLMLENGDINNAEAILDVPEERLQENLDQYELAKKLMASDYVKSIQPISQFSEKDAPGKDREISTLNVEFGALCLLCEKVAQPYSASIPEDLVTHSAKEWSIYKSVLSLEKRREEDDRVDVLYINQDKSKYGPNRKVNSMLLSACILSADVFTFELFEMSLNMSSRKLVCYPHELVRESLDLRKDLSRRIEDRKNKSRLVGMTTSTLPVQQGKTALVMREIYDQYISGSRWGLRGSTWVHVREGMPGQGIFTTISSISHASAQRYYSKYVARKLSWHWQSRVTSDDSLTMIVHPKKENQIIHNGVKTLVSKMNYLMGLIENLGKMTITARKPEMCTFYMLRGEPICAIWKFLGAFCSIQTSGNLGEDLLQATAKGADLYRLGGSVFISSYLVSSLTTMTLDAYRMWSPYLKLKEKMDATPFVEALWSGPVETFGIPAIDPICSVLSPIGPRVSSARVSGLSEEEAMNYTDMVLESSLMASRVDQEMKVTDKEGNEVGSNFIKYVTKEGEYVTTLRKMPPTVNGLIGSLYRRRHDIKVARELGKLALRYPEKTIFKGWTLLSALEHINASFEQPMKQGHNSRDVLMQYMEVAHSINHAFLKVSPNSFLPKDMIGKTISLATLRKCLNDPLFVADIRSNFRYRLGIRVEFTGSISELSGFLKRQARDIISLSDFLWSSQIGANLVSSENEEFVQECGLGRLAFKRLIKLNSISEQDKIIPYNGIKRELLERYVAPGYYTNIELKSLSLDPQGDMGEFEALAQTEVTLERLKAMIPKAMVIYSETRAGFHNRDAEITDWLTMNPFHNHHLKMSSLEVQGAIPSLIFPRFEKGSRLPGSSDDVYRSLRYGLIEGRGTKSLTWDTLNHVVRETAGFEEANLHLENKVPDTSWALMYDNRAQFTISTFNVVHICERAIRNFWYGSAHLRLKIDAFAQIRVRNEFMFVCATTTKSHYAKIYEHRLLVFPSNSCRLEDVSAEDYAILDKVFGRFGFTAPYPTSRCVSGIDAYTVQLVPSKGLKTIGLLLLDYMLLNEEGEVLLPLSVLARVSKPSEEATVLLEEMRYLPKTSHVEPSDNNLPKVPIFAMTIESQRAWGKELRELATALSRESNKGEALITTIDLMASFLISGDISSLRDNSPGDKEKELLKGTGEINEKMRRFSMFLYLTQQLPRHSLPLAVEVYETWSSRIANFVKSSLRGPQLEVLGYKRKDSSEVECRLADLNEMESKGVKEHHDDQISRYKDVLRTMLLKSEESLPPKVLEDKEEVLQDTETNSEEAKKGPLEVDTEMNLDELNEDELLALLSASAPAEGTAEIWLDGTKLN